MNERFTRRCWVTVGGILKILYMVSNLPSWSIYPAPARSGNSNCQRESMSYQLADSRRRTQGGAARTDDSKKHEYYSRCATKLDVDLR
jgi:hypothetical protein